MDFGCTGKHKSQWENQEGVWNQWVRVWKKIFFLINHFEWAIQWTLVGGGLLEGVAEINLDRILMKKGGNRWMEGTVDIIQ